MSWLYKQAAAEDPDQQQAKTKALEQLDAYLKDCVMLA